MELFKNFGTMKITEAKLREMIKQSLNEQLEEGKIGRALAGLGLAATLATSTPSCSYFNHYEPNWEQEGPRSEQEKMGKTWNTHEERGDWDNIKPGVGFIYDCYTRCANSGGGWNIHVIFKDKTTGKFILPQECQEYLYGRYVPNCNCFENEKTTDRVDTNGLQRLSGSENTTVFENKQTTNINKNMKKQTIKLNESQLRKMIKEALNELDWKTYANAARKQADIDGEYQLSHDKPNRSYKFNLAAANAFNKKYGNKGNYTDDFTRLHASEPTNWGTTELPKLHLNASDLCDDEHGFLGRDFNEKDKPYFVNKNSNGELKNVKKIPSKTLERHPELKQKFNDAEKEMEHYYNGDYDYTADKGWHLKESRLNKIIKESIKKVLNENIYDDSVWFYTEEWDDGGQNNVHAYGCISQNEADEIRDAMNRYSPYDYAVGQECETEEEYNMQLQARKEHGAIIKQH